MSRIGDAILTVEELFRKDFDDLKRLSERSLERFLAVENSENDSEDGEDGEDGGENSGNESSVAEEIYYATLEGRVYAYANIAEKLLGDGTLMKEYEAFIDWYAREVFKKIEEKEVKDRNDYLENHEALIEQYSDN